MGGIINGIQQIFTQQGYGILFLGLDGAGKQTILYKLKPGNIPTSRPFVGLSIENFHYNNLKWTCWEIGGKKTFTEELRNYLSENHAIIYVLDTSDEDRIIEAKEKLDWLLESKQLKHAPVLIYANKIDKAKLSVTEVTIKMGMNEHTSRSWHIQGCCAITGEGLQEGIEWLSKIYQTQN